MAIGMAALILVLSQSRDGSRPSPSPTATPEASYTPPSPVSVVPYLPTPTPVAAVTPQPTSSPTSTESTVRYRSASPWQADARSSVGTTLELTTLELFPSAQPARQSFLAREGPSSSGLSSIQREMLELIDDPKARQRVENQFRLQNQQDGAQNLLPIMDLIHKQNMKIIENITP